MRNNVLTISGESIHLPRILDRTPMVSHTDHQMIEQNHLDDGENSARDDVPERRCTREPNGN